MREPVTIDLTGADDQDWMNGNRTQNEAVVADAQTGDRLALSRYIDTVVVQSRCWLGQRMALTDQSPRGSATYRLRAIDDDDRLLLERPTDDGWTRHLRVDATRPGN